MPALTNKIEANGLKRDPLAYKWQKGKEEKPETVREIEAKSKRLASHVNKQGYSYITPGSDPTTFGRK